MPYSSKTLWHNLDNTYLECEVEVGKIGVLCRLKNVSFKMYVSDLVNLQHLLLVDLFEGEEISMQVHQRYYTVGAASEIFDKLKVFH